MADPHRNRTAPRIVSAAAFVLAILTVGVSGAEPQPSKAPVRTDRLGDPLPPGAVARIGTARLRHGAAQAMAFSPDGTVLATGGENSVSLWEVRSGREIRRLPQIKGRAFRVAFSPDGRLLAAGGDYQTVHLWETATGKEIYRVRGHRASVAALAFSPDGKMLASASTDGVAKLWDVGARALRHTLNEPNDVFAWAAFFPDGKTLLTYCQFHGRFRSWDVASGRLLDRRLAIGRARPVALTPDGKSLLVVSAGVTQRRDLTTGKRTGTYQGVYPALAPDGKSLTTLHEGHVRLWDLASGKEVRRFPVGRDTACAAVFAPDGKTLALTGQAVHFWDVSTGKQIFPFGDDPGAIAQLALTADGKTAVTVCDGGAVFLWDAATGQPRGRVKAMAAVPYCLAVSPDGRTVATGVVGTNAIALGDVRGERPVRTLRGPQGWANDLAFSPDGSTLAAVAGPEIALWDVRSAKVVRRLPADAAPSPLAFTPGGKGVFSPADGGTVALWDVATGRRVRTFGVPWRGDFIPSVFGLALSPNGKMLAVTRAKLGETFGVELWEVATARRIGVLARDRQIWGAAFSPDGRRLVSCGDDGTLRLWDLPTGQELQTFRGHRGRVKQASFTPDGRRVVSRGADGTGLVWDVSGLGKRRAAAALEKSGRLVGAPREARAALARLAAGGRVE